MSIRDRLAQLKELDSRKAAILKSLDERKLLTPELTAAVMGAQTLSKLEDLYLPYRPKKRTRAMIAKEKGLEPLADSIFAQGAEDPLKLAAAFISEEMGVGRQVDTQPGAPRTIIAERVSPRTPPRARRYARCSSRRARSTPRS